MMIDLRSDTVTRPTKGMLEAMFSAKVGDDVFAEDPTVLALEEKSAELFGKEAALFCPSGTMTNQIAIKVHTRPLEQIICPALCHIYNYEVGGHAFHSGVSVKLVEGNRGRLTADKVMSRVNPDFDWLPVTRLVWLENTCNRAGGSYYDIATIQEIQTVCQEHHLKMHLDGARVFNALAETGTSAAEMGRYFDSISFCLSKGLGAPVGSLLVGDKDFIRKARRVRKVMGGGMRQAGYLAAAGSYALDHHIDRLQEDHERAKILGEVLEGLPFIEKVLSIETNIVIFELKDKATTAAFIQQLDAQGIKVILFGDTWVRMVTHLDFTGAMLEKTIAVIKQLRMGNE